VNVRVPRPSPAVTMSISMIAHAGDDGVKQEW
jgi:hypothetical protein